MKIIVAIDSLKGCLSSREACDAVACGLRRQMPEAEVLSLPVSDGGEGWLDAVESAIGGTRRFVEVLDPLGRPVQAAYLMQGKTAVVEMAQASGLCLLREEERNPLKSSSYGTGQLIVDAIAHGAKEIVVGLGGSATSDAGKGVVGAMRGTDISDVTIVIATDVKNPLLGQEGAARVFAPQKGATQEMVEMLEAEAEIFARNNAIETGRDCSMCEGAGAAGGVGYALMQFCGAHRVSGIDWLMDQMDIDSLLSKADLVVTGEGRADRQSLMGKVAVGMLERAKLHGVPVCLVAGQVTDSEALLQAGFSQVFCFNPPGLSLSEAMKPEVARQNLRKLRLKDESFRIFY